MTENSNKRLFDTNILVYAFDTAEKEKHEIAKNLFFNLFSKGQTSLLSIQTLSEFFVISTEKLSRPIDKNEAYEIIEKITASENIKILRFDESTVLSAIDTNVKYGTSYWDSLIAETMRKHNIFTVITENEKDFKKIPWLIVINPFK